MRRKFQLKKNWHSGCGNSCTLGTDSVGSNPSSGFQDDHAPSSAEGIKTPPAGRNRFLLHWLHGGGGGGDPCSCHLHGWPQTCAVVDQPAALARPLCPHGGSTSLNTEAGPTPRAPPPWITTPPPRRWDQRPLWTHSDCRRT